VLNTQTLLVDFVGSLAKQDASYLKLGVQVDQALVCAVAVTAFLVIPVRMLVSAFVLQQATLSAVT
jgi:hypothetical protein